MIFKAYLKGSRIVIDARRMHMIIKHGPLGAQKVKWETNSKRMDDDTLAARSYRHKP